MDTDGDAQKYVFPVAPAGRDAALSREGGQCPRAWDTQHPHVPSLPPHQGMGTSPTTSGWRTVGKAAPAQLIVGGCGPPEISLYLGTALPNSRGENPPKKAAPPPLPGSRGETVTRPCPRETLQLNQSIREAGLLQQICTERCPAFMSSLGLELQETCLLEHVQNNFLVH